MALMNPNAWLNFRKYFDPMVRYLFAVVLLLPTFAIPDEPSIHVVSQTFQNMSGSDGKLFTRLEGREIGVHRPMEFSFRDFAEPFWNSKGISSGDFDNDGDDDLVLASSHRGLLLFENTGEGKFSEVDLDKGDWADFPGLLAAFVDLNDDGWLDIFISGYYAGLHVIWNDQGSFDFSKISNIANSLDAVLSQATSFGDLDRDGDLDLVVGNWAAGHLRHFPGEESRSRIIFNDAGTITGELGYELDGVTGETLTVLLSDFDRDGDLDIFEGNDFAPPDQIFLGSGTENFERVQAQDLLIERTTTSTMSIKSADFNNDLIPEIFFSQIAGRADGVSEKLRLRPVELYCIDLADPIEAKICQENIEAKSWYRSGGRQVDVSSAPNCQLLEQESAAACKALMIKDIAIQKNDVSICEFINKSQRRAAQLCQTHFLTSLKPTPKLIAESIPQHKGFNVLLALHPDGDYRDIAEQVGLDVGGWSWDVKIEDFDLDGFLDVYITNGYWTIPNVTPSNLYFKNISGTHFRQEAFETGLEEFLILTSLTSTDIDNDGDLDLIGQAVNGPVVAFRNNVQNPNRIAFQVEDYFGNRFGVGTKIEVFYGDQQKQMRELQTGGGFQSYDSSKAYFGLGAHTQVDKIHVFWSTGETTDIKGPFEVGRMHTIVRK